MRIAQFLLCLFCFSLFTAESFALDDVTDLGERGFSHPLDLKNRGAAPHLTPKNNLYFNPVDFSYKAKMVKHDGPVEIRHLSFKKNFILPIGTKIFVFSCYDEDSIRLASTVNFDYGLCIEYKSLNDIKDFKEKAGINKPIQIANDDIVGLFKISSYPELITVKEDGFEIQEGF